MAHFNNTKSRKSNWRNKFVPTETANDANQWSSFPSKHQNFTWKPTRLKPTNEPKNPAKTSSWFVEQTTSKRFSLDFNDFKPNAFQKNKTSNATIVGNPLVRPDEGSLFGGGTIGRPEILAITLGGLLLFWLLLALIVLYVARWKRSKSKNCFAKIAAIEASKNKINDVIGDERHRKVLELGSPNDEACLILSPSSCTFNLCSPVTSMYPGLNNSWVNDDFKSPSTCSMSYPFLGYQRSASEEPGGGRHANESKNNCDHDDYVEINNIKMDECTLGRAKPGEVGEEYLTIDRFLKRSTFDGSSTDGTTRTNVSSLLADQTLRKQNKDLSNKRESAFSEYYLQSGGINLSVRTLEADSSYNHGSHHFLKQAVMNSGPRKIPTMGSSVSLQRKGVPSLVSPSQLSSSLSQFAESIDKNKVTTPNSETNFETLPAGTIFTTQALMTRMNRRSDDCPPLPPRKIRRENSPPLISPRLISPVEKHYRSIPINQNQGQTGSQKSSHYADSRCRASVQFECKQRMRNMDSYNLTPQLLQKSAENSLPEQQAQPTSRKLSKKMLSQSFDKPRQPIMGQTRLAERNKSEQNATTTVAAMNQQSMLPFDNNVHFLQQQQQQQQQQYNNSLQGSENISHKLHRVKRPDKIFSTSTPTLPKRQSQRECRTEVLQRRWLKCPESNITVAGETELLDGQRNSVSGGEPNSEESVWKYNRLNNINSPDDEVRQNKNHNNSVV